MIKLGLSLGLLGLVAASALVIYQGAGPVILTFASARWGLLWVALYHAVPMLANARAWQVLLPGRAQPSFRFFTWMVWVRGRELHAASGAHRRRGHGSMALDHARRAQETGCGDARGGHEDVAGLAA